MLGGHGIVGGHIPLATGTAFAAKYQQKDYVTLCFFGEAAVNIGAFHESLNMAALWKLPVIYIVENNRFGMGTAIERSSAIYDVAQRACAYDMASETVDGMDVLAVREVIGRAVDLARRESLPTLIEARCYRFMGHSMSDPVHGHYRTKEEVEDQKQQDPIKQYFEHLKAAGHRRPGDARRAGPEGPRGHGAGDPVRRSQPGAVRRRALTRMSTRAVRPLHPERTVTPWQSSPTETR